MTTMSTRREPEDNDLPGAVVDSDDHNRDSRRKEESGKSQWELGMEFNRRKTGLYLYALGFRDSGINRDPARVPRFRVQVLWRELFRSITFPFVYIQEYIFDVPNIMYPISEETIPENVSFAYETSH
jgi:hypothetical protein